ncbi:MAG: aminomethyl-transferring glycine dehydrogenase [Verrucomicrobiaceae bacterium]|nr:aminomethyl-transferring glycine dehydrogenase [Verrucomicrobiaceae bacterium]
MLKTLGCSTLDELIDQVVPEAIRDRAPLALDEPMSEEQALATMRKRMSANQVLRSFIGMGYHDTFTPPVIQRNILENPGWYTAYTPYQAEISQGRLEALLNYQTMICDLTALDVANASMLDEGTAAAEACALALANKPGSNFVILSDKVHPHVVDVIITRMEPLGVMFCRMDLTEFEIDAEDHKNLAAVVAAYPDTLGVIRDLSGVADEVHKAGALFVVCADLLALTLLKPPGEFGADICVGNSQRFGVPLGFGGPHAAFMAVKDALKRRLPGRLIGISQDATGKPGYRLSLQTREQHIRREKATSNICTAQVLLAVMASMYAVYHGPEGLKAIASRVNSGAAWLAGILKAGGLKLEDGEFFDTLCVTTENADEVIERALALGINLRRIDNHRVGVALDERSTSDELKLIVAAFGDRELSGKKPFVPLVQKALISSSVHARTSTFLTHPVFNSYHSETEMMRYLHRLESKDIALNRSMIPLGSCTMKLNAAAEMMPLSWAEVGRLHPFVPHDQTRGYQLMFAELENWLATCTGFAAVSLQPNAGSQGEYAGLLAIHHYHKSRGEGHRDVCLIPTSAHGTNPASAAMAGMKVVPVACDDHGNISLDSLREKLAANEGKVSCLMVTYPSTHGVFEESIAEICALVHQHGGQVYMDGANMNAQVGLTSPGKIGADVCHLNLHKTFCIPHGGGGPGVGPIGVAAHLKPFLPGHFTLENKSGAVCSAPWGSASICTISWMYVAMMGARLTDATKFAILNANYVAKKLEACFPTLYKGRSGFVAHECILDFRHFKKVTVEDVAKRLMDFGYHAPTMSWPVGGTLMVEPTESESKAELDRFCDAMQAIFKEIEQVENGALPADDNPLKHAPHTAEVVLADDWTRPYSRNTAAFPLPWVRDDKYWPPVSRIDNVFGDRHLICTCPSVEEAAATH